MHACEFTIPLVQCSLCVCVVLGHVKSLSKLAEETCRRRGSHVSNRGRNGGRSGEKIDERVLK